MRAEPRPRGPLGVAWTTTFVDLAALLLAFFVLVFSMSSLQQHRFDQLSFALVQRDRPGPEAPSRPLERLSSPRQATGRATPIDYLQPLLRHRLDEIGLLVPHALERLPDGLVLRFDAALLLQADGLRPTFQGRLLLRQLAALLDPLANALVLRHRPASAQGDGLGAALVAAGSLRRAGYGRPFAVQGLPGGGGRAELEIEIRERARED
jgi:chemotaxis protein MotB